MTPKKYMQKTACTLKIIHALRGVFTLDYEGANQCRNNMDTDGLIRHISKIRELLATEIDRLMEVKEECLIDGEYEEFAKRTDRVYAAGKQSDLKWSEIPDRARKEVFEAYRRETCNMQTVDEETHDKVMSKIFEYFKRKYNINRIIL